MVGFCISWMALFLVLFPMSIYLNPSKGGTTNVFYLGVLLPWLILVMLGEVRLWYKQAAYLSGLLLFSYLWLNSFWGVDNSAEDWFYLGKRWVFAVCMLTAPILVCKKYPNFHQRILPLLFTASVMAAAIVIAQHYAAHGSDLLKFRLLGEGYSVNAIAVGVHYGLALLVGLYLLSHYPRQRWVIAASCLLPLTAMVLTQSRGPLLAFITCVCLMALFGERERRVLIVKAALLMVVAVMMLTIGWDYFVSRGLSYRPEIWSKMLGVVMQSPIFGEGYTLNAEQVSIKGREFAHSHNIFIELMRYGGIVAVALFVWHLVSLFRVQRVNNDALSRVYLLLLVYTLLILLINGWYLLDRPNYLWFGYWYPIGLLLAREQLQSAASR
ncbi:MAG: hypothetical protein ACJAYG_001284 [Oceanicoccus sp.]|jgi:hypothetical protein